ncbi:Peroxiredoxin family protein [Halanaeroarchaeum sp. HSR-CO]|uniref:DsrE/DsrF/DrsH-like family protein n=1 Tax=Halanaeroarchaeum sp. HSR-CO TaxID=2866382 RepID=UPI00217D54E6|nr:DsrE/DsrF/DrsH-like family protein [Halanaeroarchaeum sp. HSR-CO]UWG47654.1 Peroxiredoxin family protein [Halanaeroarchaeum sp. HSR-CO]
MTDDEPSVEELEAQIEALEAKVDGLAIENEEDGTTKMTIVAVSGTLDMAYPTLILSSIAGAFDWDVTVFASFWALDMLHEDKHEDLKMSSVGNPAMPIPNLLAVLPGMDAATTWMMRKQIDEVGTDTVPELIERAMAVGVEFQACQMTMDLMDYEDDDFIEGVTTGVGAAHALRNMAKSDVQLLV